MNTVSENSSDIIFSDDTKEEGRLEGLEKGRQEAITEERTRVIKKKLEKNKSSEQIADEPEICVEEVKMYISLIQG